MNLLHPFMQCAPDPKFNAFVSERCFVPAYPPMSPLLTEPKSSAVDSTIGVRSCLGVDSSTADT